MNDFYFTSQGNQDVPIPKEFFTYWSHIPLIRVLKPHYFDKLFHIHRVEILEILTKGLTQVNPVTKEEVVRNVLSAAEIQDALQKRKGLEIKKPTLYHHLLALEESDLIKVVSSLKLPNRVKAVKFYGKTSKLIFKEFDDDVITKFKVFEDNNFVDFLHNLGEYDHAQTATTLSKLNTIEQNQIEEFRSWYTENEKLLEGNFQNILDLLYLFNFLNKFETRFIDWILKMRQILKINE